MSRSAAMSFDTSSRSYRSIDGFSSTVAVGAACNDTAPMWWSGPLFSARRFRRLTDRRPWRSALGQMAHSPTGLLRSHLPIRQAHHLARRRFAMAQPEHGNVPGPPTAMELGIELRSGAFEPLLARLPQRADR